MIKHFSKVTFLYLFCASSALFADSLIDEYLSIYDDSKSNKQNMEQFYDENPFQSSMVEKARVSMDLAHLHDIEKEYTVRLYTKSLSQIKNDEAIYNLKKDLSLNTGNSSKSQILKDRYKTLIDMMYQQNLLTYLNKEINLYHKNLKIETFIVEDESDIIDVYDVKQKISELNLQKLKVEQKCKRLVKKIKNVISFKKMVEIRRELNIQLFLNSYQIISHISENLKALNSPDEAETTQYKLALAKRKIKSVDIENEVKLDNIEVKYDDSKKRKNAFSVGVSFEVPISKNELKRVNEKMKFLELQNKIAENREVIGDKIEEMKEDIGSLIEFIQALETQIKINKQSMKNDFITPKLAIKIKKKAIKLKKERDKVVHQLLLKYVSLLYIVDQLETSDLRSVIQHYRSS